MRLFPCGNRRNHNHATWITSDPRRDGSGTAVPLPAAVSRTRRGRWFAFLWPAMKTGPGVACPRLFSTTLAVCAVLSGWSAAEEAGNENQLLQQLIQLGVRFPGKMTVKLPEPELVDGLDESQQRKVLGQIAQRHGWEQFVRDSTVAPFRLKQAYLKDRQGRRVGHAVDLWFIAHGPLRIFQETSRAKDVFGTAWTGGNRSDVTIQELNGPDVLARGIKKIDEDVEKYALVAFSLMNKVYVQGVGHVRRSHTDQSVVIAWELDPRFNKDAHGEAPDALDVLPRQSDYRENGLGEAPVQTEDSKSRRYNCWRPIETTKLGRRKQGDPRPYQGYGGYLKITDLSVPEGALLFEAHVVFHEPTDWFRGSNFLRSKTPLMVKESINTVRRKLASKRHRDG